MGRRRWTVVVVVKNARGMQEGTKAWRRHRRPRWRAAREVAMVAAAVLPKNAIGLRREIAKACLLVLAAGAVREAFLLSHGPSHRISTTGLRVVDSHLEVEVAVAEVVGTRAMEVPASNNQAPVAQLWRVEVVLVGWDGLRTCVGKPVVTAIKLLRWACMAVAVVERETELVSRRLRSSIKM